MAAINLTLCLSLFLVIVGMASAQLSSTYYSSTCPNVLTTIKTAVSSAVSSEARMGASLLRLHFHDCFVNGCDASVLLDDNSTFTGEKTAAPNANSLRGFDVIDTIKSQVESSCPGVVSCADILAVAARDSVVALGGPSWTVQLGRRDSTTASLSAANSNIPGPTLNLSALITAFSNQGLSANEMVALSDVRQPSKNFRKSFYLGKDLKKLLDLPIEKRKAPLLLNFIPTYTSKLADTPRKRKKSASPSTASTEQVASTSEPADQPSTSAPHSIPVQEKKRRRRLVKTAEMEKPKKKVLNLLADLPEDMEDAPPPPKPKRVKKAQPKAKVTDVDADEDAVPISKLAEKTTSASSKRPAEAQPPKPTAAKKQKSSAGTSSGSRVAKVPWEPKVTLEDRPVYTHESAADVEIGVALSTAVLLGGDMEKNEKKSGYENYTLMLQHSVQAIQHAHSFSMVAFETGKRLENLEKEFALLHKQNMAQQLKMKELEDQAEEAIKAKQIADEQLGAAEAIKTVAIAQQKEAEEKAAQAEEEKQEALASKKAEVEAAYNQGMADVAEDYKLQVKQACNKGFILGWNALAKKLDLPADSPWRKTKGLRLPCPLPPSEDESESEAEAEGEDETLVRKAKSPPKIDLTGDEEVEAAPKKTDFGTLTSDLLLIGRSVEETVAEIDAEVAAEKQAEVAADKGTGVAAEKETEVLAVNDAEVVEQRDAEKVLPESSEVLTQPSA